MTIPRSAAVAIVCSTFVIWPAARIGHSTGVLARASVQASRAGELWLAPEPGDVLARQALARAVADLTTGHPAEALQVFQDAVSDPVLGGYALLYLGRTELALSRPAAATVAAQQLLSSSPAGYLEEAALGLAADAAAAEPDPAAGFRALQRLAELPAITAPATVRLRLGIAASQAGDREAAIRAWTRVYFEYPLSPEAVDAAAQLSSTAATPKPSTSTFAPILARAERLFSGKQYTDARSAFASLKTLAKGDDVTLIDLRLAQCDFFLKRYAATLTALRTYPTKANSRATEAELLYLGTLRELGRTAEYLARLKTFVDRDADPVLAERALNDLATFYVRGSDDEKAAETFADMYRRFPQGAFADRAAWKAGWWAYKTGRYAEAARIFESAEAGMRHADYRPGWLYWAARAHMQLGETDAALQGYAHAIADYRNTYYGRASIRESERIQAARRPAGAGPVSPASVEWPRPIATGARPENALLVRSLLAAGLYEEAIGELRRVQATSGTSPMVEATIAFALNRQGRLRPAIQTMRHAYPQFMAAGGEALPEEILTIIFPVDHWDAIQQHASAKNLDRFLVAALIAQESTFQADIKSSANAWGLMQILPATGRQYAQRLSIRPFSTMRLTDPETNLQIGTTIFSDLLKRFGDVAPALAAYNAGESRVVRWLADRPGADRDEFIDDIPFAETQNYVKRILGTAEDYRRLYR